MEILRSCAGRFYTVRITSLLKLIYTFKTVTSLELTSNSRIYIGSQRNKNNQNKLEKKNNIGGLTLFDLKT